MEKYGIQSTNKMAFKRSVYNFTRVFDFPPSDLMRPHYYHSEDTRMRTQIPSLLLSKEVEKKFIFTQKWLDHKLLITSYLVTIATEHH